jgi:hypothetical protein
MPTFDSFFERLTREQDKLIQMGALGSKNSKSHALVGNSSSNSRIQNKNASKWKQTQSTKE